MPSSAPASIRRRVDDDLPGVAALLLATHHSDGYPVAVPSDLETWGAANPVLDAWVAVGSDAGPLVGDRVLDGARGEGEGEETGRAVVGHVVLTEPDEGAATAQWVAATGLPVERLGVVRRLVTSAEVHGRGIGRQLLSTAVAGAHHRGLRPVLDMAANLGVAQGLYLRSGFEAVGSYRLVIGVHAFDVLTFVGPPPP